MMMMIFCYLKTNWQQLLFKFVLSLFMCCSVEFPRGNASYWTKYNLKLFSLTGLIRTRILVFLDRLRLGINSEMCFFMEFLGTVLVYDNGYIRIIFFIILTDVCVCVHTKYEMWYTFNVLSVLIYLSVYLYLFADTHTLVYLSWGIVHNMSGQTFHFLQDIELSSKYFPYEIKLLVKKNSGYYSGSNSVAEYSYYQNFCRTETGKN